LRRFVRVLCFASLVAIVLFLAAVSSPGLAEPASSGSPRLLELASSPDSASSNSSSGTIMITMTGMVGDPGDLSGR